jgi:hypothetical protein
MKNGEASYSHLALIKNARVALEKIKKKNN